MFSGLVGMALGDELVCFRGLFELMMPKLLQAEKYIQSEIFFNQKSLGNINSRILTYKII